MPYFRFRILVVAACALVVPELASAQASIAGTVRDASGAVVPAVTVSASSHALIERTRTVLTDGTGQYSIVDLRPGIYTVTFTLAGFNTFKRDGIELEGQFAGLADHSGAIASGSTDRFATRATTITRAARSTTATRRSARAT
jgi:hypothetical protein